MSRAARPRVSPVERMEAGLSRAIEALAALCLFVLFALIVTLVLLRYVFNAGVVGANESATVLFVYATALGAAVEVGRREHIAVTALVERLKGKARRWVEVFAFALVALINAVIAWQSIGWIAVTGGYLMPATQVPRFVAQFAVPLGCVLATVYCLIAIRRTFHKDKAA